MKKLLFLLCFGISISCYSQEITDDGLVTSNLSGITNQELITDFMEEFNTGLENARTGTYTSLGSISTLLGQLGYDPREELTLAEWGESELCPVSGGFLETMISINNSLGSASTSITAIRQEMVGLAESGELSGTEANFLALFDLAVQSISESFDIDPEDYVHLRSQSSQSFGIYSDHDELGLLSLSQSFGTNSDHRSFFLNSDQARLWGWLRCALGILGSAILGGLQGAGTGSQIAPGIGTAIGAVVGFVGGGFVGAAAFC